MSAQSMRDLPTNTLKNSVSFVYAFVRVLSLSSVEYGLRASRNARKQAESGDVANGWKNEHPGFFAFILAF